MAAKVWFGEGRLSDQALCNADYEVEFGKAVLEELRKKRREEIKDE